MVSFDAAQVKEYYKRVTEAHEEHLKALGITLPRLQNGENFSKDAIVLAFLAKNLGKPVSKATLTEVIRHFYPDTNDVQQGRHLGKQKGWNIASGRRGDFSVELANDEYCLVSLETAYPGFLGSDGPRSVRMGKDFQEIKASYGFRCATCGSREGEINLINPGVKTKIQEGHMDPRKPLSLENVIPQCQVCNQAYTDKFVFDGQGRVVDINISSPTWRNRYKTLGN